MSNSSFNFSFALDGNEANVKNRVGSNIFAFQVLKNLEKITREKNEQKIKFTVLLSQQPVLDLPQPRKNWQYQVIKPKKFWTQWAEPWHLFFKQKKYDALFVPGHYAPRVSAVPYICSIMDLAYLKYSAQFRQNDYLQLKNWTKYSVKHAKKVVAISEFTKQEIWEAYGKPLEQIEVVYPDVNLDQTPISSAQKKAFFKKHGIKPPFFLFVGTLQPRKNLIRLVKAFAKFKAQVKAAHSVQLVIAGKIGWLTQDLIAVINQSPVEKDIILPGYVSDKLKNELYNQALATILVGLYEGFGIPPLESMHFGTIPLVSNNSSLPEVVGAAGLKVDPYKVDSIKAGLIKVWNLPDEQKEELKKAMKDQIKKFSWEQSTQKILSLLKEVTQE